LQHTNIAVLNRAARPYKPTWPNIFIDGVLAAFLGLSAGIALVALQENLNRRVRNTEQLAQLADVPAFSLSVSSGHSLVANSRRPRWFRPNGWLRRSRERSRSISQGASL
jgi:hypothetical protein